jgi:putative flavoprotein involved in K+ transport
MAADRVETLIIGGGQAGLAMSRMLSRRGCPHLVLERGRIGERWRSERWEGLRFQFPNWSVHLPDFPFPHVAPDAFATSAEIVEYLAAYAEFVAAPIRCSVAVTALRQHRRGGFVAETEEGAVEAKNVVVATGPYQAPVVPDLLSPAVALFEVHASRYRAPEQLPPGAVLIIGSGASGTQIAEELLRAGRRVYLSVGRHRRIPRRYRGHDLIWWLSELGLDQTPVEERGPDKALPLITGAYGGHTIDFRCLAEQGVTLLGHLRGTRDGVLEFAADLATSLAHGDAAYAAFLDLVDAHVERENLDVPAEPGARAVHPDPQCVRDPLLALKPHETGIGAVVWATGYRSDFGWIELPVLDAAGDPLHRGGVSTIPGLYFLGLPWLSRMNSSFLSGVGDDAARLADHVAVRRQARLRGNRPTELAVGFS